MASTQVVSLPEPEVERHEVVSPSPEPERRETPFVIKIAQVIPG